MNFKMTPYKLMISLFAIVLLAVPIATAVLPKREMSENENRALKSFPKIINEKKAEKAENIGDYIGAVRWDYITTRDDDSWMDDFETYFSDHLAGRESWVKLSNGMTALSGKKEINGVYTLDDCMVQVFREYDPDVVDASLAAIDAFAQKFPDVPMYFMLDPTAQEILSSQIPSYAGYLSEKSFIDDCYGKVKNVSVIDCLSNLSVHNSEYIFYRTDHHWTSLGAYYAYAAAAKSLGYTAYGQSAFNIETASSSFRGTLYSKTLDDSITPDTISYYHLAHGEPAVKMTSFDGETETVYDSLYVRSFLDQKSKYDSFTGSNAPLVTIETDVDNGKSLLLIKDSYAHSLVPFLSKHYSKITMVDMRYINFGLDRYLDVNDYSQVLFTFNVISFSSDRELVKIGLTK